jgi:RimJ/RimL family protein N-acetyltransferase
MANTTIQTARLILRPPTEGDFEDWANLDADPEAVSFIGGVQDRVNAWQGLATTVGMWTLRGCGLFSVIERDTGAWIGRVGPWIPEGAIGTEVGWAFAPRVWGKGYATEAAGAAVAWAFENLAWTEVIHCIHRDNKASIAVAHRVGSSWMRSDREADGKPVEVYGQSRATWRSARIEANSRG